MQKVADRGTKRNTAIGSSRQHSAQDEHTRRARPVSYFPTAHTVRPRRCRVLGDASRVAADRQVGPCCFCAGLFRWLLCCVPLARRHPMHKQQPPGLLRSGCDGFPSPGGWFEPPRSDLSGRDDATPPSVCAGATWRMTRRHPMHKQQPPGLLRSGCDVFPSPGGWFEPPRSDLSGRDDATPPSVCAGRRAR